MATKEKLEFVYAMAKHSTVTLNECKRLLRYAATFQRLSVLECNRQMSVAEIRKQENVGMDIIAILSPHDCEAVLGGDPRGCVVKVKTPDGYTNDFGGEGICVPSLP
jgi:hypothetical protein